MVQAPAKLTWTIYDVEVLPENPAIQYELIAGDLLVTRTPSVPFTSTFAKPVKKKNLLT